VGLEFTGSCARVGLLGQLTVMLVHLDDIRRWKHRYRCESKQYPATLGNADSLSVRVDDLKGIIKGICLDDAKSRTEDLLPALSSAAAIVDNRADALVSLHSGSHMEHGRSDKVAVLVAVNLGVTSIQKDLATFLFNRSDQ
jgi:hypothetical protein